MSIATSPSPGQIPGEPYRISLRQYNALTEHGVLTKRDRCVLLDGILVSVPPRTPEQVYAGRSLFELLRDLLPSGWDVFKRDPLALPGGPDGDSVPEPDATVVRGRLEDYAWRRPTAADAALVVEVAGPGSRGHRPALRRYAHAKIPSAWIVDPVEHTVAVYNDPSGPGLTPGYDVARLMGPRDSIEVILDGHAAATIAVAEIFPRLAP